jgi:hypothetical protein
LTNSQTEIIHKLISQLELDTDHYNIRINAQRSLLNLGPQIIPDLILKLTHQSIWIVSSLIEIIGELTHLNPESLAISQSHIIKSLIPFLASKELIILRKTVNALAKLGDIQSIPEIIRLLCHDSWHVKSCVAEALGQFFEHEELHEVLYHSFLDAYLKEDNREDYLLRILNETNWNLNQICFDPSSELHRIFSHVPLHGFGKLDRYLIFYFYPISLNLCDWFMELNRNQEHFPLYQQIHIELEERHSLHSEKYFHLLI